MISENTVNAVKEAARIVDVIQDFVPLKKNGSQWECNCMFHEEKSPSFKIESKENFYKCFGCGAAGDSLEFLMKYKQWDYPTAVKHLANKYRIPVEVQNEESKKTYTRPVWKNTLTLDDNVVKWFENERKISQATLNKMKVTSEIEWMPEGKIKKGGVPETIPAGKRKVIAFNYFKDGELINRKLRDRHKTMRMDKDAELIWYNIDSLKDAKRVYIVEGEPDTATLIQIGLDLIPGNAILSVPNGANVKSNNLAYIDSSIDLFEHVEEIYIGVDNDIAGRKLREDLAERFGKDRCYFLEWKDKKDSNEVLVAYGPQAVMECVADKKEFPLEGVFTISHFSDEIDDMYINGMDRGAGLGMGRLDSLIRFASGYITVITGVPNHGKSDALDQVILKLMTIHGWTCGFYSPENRPTKLHFSKMARKLIGKNWSGKNRMTEQEKNLVKSYLEGKVWFIKPEKDFTIETILAHAKMLKMRKGIKCFTIDAWNRLEHKFGKHNETTYINETLLKIDAFCELNNMHCFLVVHPSKQAKDKKTGQIECPNLYSLSGSAHFYNIIANGITIYRDFLKGITTWHVQKVKFSHWGEIGSVDFKYDRETGRYYEDITGNMPDYSNWILEGQKQAELDLNVPPEPLILPTSGPGIIYSAIDYEDPPF